MAAAENASSGQATPPLPPTRLKQIATDVCESALANATSYNPLAVDDWNSKIVNSFLKALVSESSSSSSTSTDSNNNNSTNTNTGTPKYKFAVNSTIIQHPLVRSNVSTTGSGGGGVSTGTSTTADADASSDQKPLSSSPAQSSSPPPPPPATESLVEKSVPLKRGMHSASGAYWNNARDGMWTHKYEGADGKGMDVVLLVMWIAL